MLSDYLRGGHSGVAEALAWIALPVGLAWLSWRFVEQPVRHARRLSGGIVWGASAAASVVLLALGGWLFVRDGLPGRFGPEARVHIAASGDFLQDWSRCDTADSLPLDGLDVCPIGPEGAPRVLVWGDSHVRAMREGLDAAAHRAGTPGIILWRAGCPPLFGLRKSESAATQSQDTACRQANTQIEQAFARLDSVDTLLLIGRWAYYAAGAGVGLDASNTIRVQPADRAPRAGESQARILTAAARSTVGKLRPRLDGIHVLRQSPELPAYDSRTAAREAAHAGWPLAARKRTQGSVLRDAIALRAALADAPWIPLAEEGAVSLIDPWPLLCDESRCHALHAGVGQYFDNNHLTNAAALRLSGLFDPVFRRPGRQAALNGPGE